MERFTLVTHMNTHVCIHQSLKCEAPFLSDHHELRVCTCPYCCVGCWRICILYIRCMHGLLSWALLCGIFTLPVVCPSESKTTTPSVRVDRVGCGGSVETAERPIRRCLARSVCTGNRTLFVGVCFPREMVLALDLLSKEGRWCLLWIY